MRFLIDAGPGRVIDYRGYEHQMKPTDLRENVRTTTGKAKT